MGEYFEWVNFTKRQYLQVEAFSGGIKALEDAFVGAEMTDAATSLIATAWSGDLVVFLGEYCRGTIEDVSPAAHPGLATALSYPVDYYDIEYEFEDATGRLSCCTGRDGWDFSTGEPVRTVYSGPGDIALCRYRYIVNETKREFYDRERTDPGFWRSSRVDLLPVLLGSSTGHLVVDGARSTEPDGMWVGDLLRPSNIPPQGGYRDVSETYTIAW